MTNPDSRAQGLSEGSSAYSTTHEAPARDPFDELATIANRVMHRVEILEAKLKLAMTALNEIQTVSEREQGLSFYLARGALQEMERLR